jgi:hypothetical protein
MSSKKREDAKEQFKEGQGLKIASVEAFTLHVPTEPRSTAWTFARVTTKEGLIGVGEGIGTPAPVCAAINYFGNKIVGEAAWDIERLWVAMYRAAEFTRSGVNQAVFLFMPFSVERLTLAFPSTIIPGTLWEGNDGRCLMKGNK